MSLLAGTAVRDISPPQPAFLVGYPHVPRTSTGVHDPLLASALCLHDGTTGLALVSVDILFMDPPTARRVRRGIAAHTGLPETHVFISCTHTHSGPVTASMLAWQEDPVVPPPDPLYMQAFEAGIVSAATAAYAACATPAAIAWTTAAVSGVGGNRLSADGTADPQAGILCVRDRRQGRPLALALVYSMHPTVLHEDSTLISADFPGFARRQLAEHLDPGLVTLYHTGPCGNQSPRYHVRGQTFAEAERLGRALGQSVGLAVDALPATAYAESAALAGCLTPVDLPAHPLSDVAEAQAGLHAARARYHALQESGAERAVVRTAECAVFGAEERLALARCRSTGALGRTLASYLPAEVQVVRLGDTCLAGLPGELFVEYGLEIKRRTGGRAFAVSLVNGDLQGYIVTPEAAAAGGYEAANAVFAPAAGQRLVDAAVADAHRLLAGA